MAIQNFMVEGQRPNDQQQEIISTPTEETITVATFTEEIIGATSTPEVTEETTSTKVETLQEQQEETTSTPPIQEIHEEEIDTETTSTRSESEPISFFGKVKKIFSGETVKAQQLPTFEELVEEDFQSAKIKFSFAIGEKEPDITIIEQQATSSESEINNTTLEESTSFWKNVRDFFSSLTTKINQLTKVLLTKASSIAKAEEENPPTEVMDIGYPSNGEIVGETTTIENTTTTEEITEEIPIPSAEGGAMAEVTTEATGTETLPNLDAKIIIWWSLDSSTSSPQDWQILDTITSYPLSNALNGDYFAFDAPFLKNWEDVKNLKIKFEGVVGGETKIVAYVDSVWIEVEYQKKEEREEFELKAIKKDWRADEIPEFEVVPKGEKAQENIAEKLLAEVSSVFEEEPKVGAILIKPDDKELSLQEGKDFSSETHSPTRIKIFKQEDFRPGLQKLKITYEKNGNVYNLEAEFTWGVLAINANKSIYLPNETAYLQMAALRDDGHTICDANLKLEIIAPNGGLSSVNVQRSEECGPDNVTDKPDYFTYYQTEEKGIYQIKLTNLDSGNEITDSFEVRDSVPFEIERIGSTRIWPKAAYEMTFKIKANQDFSGEVIEIVPVSFVIIETSDSRQETRDGGKAIIWDVDWKMGETYELKYTFDAPDVSPYLYLLGPLQIGDFKEIRQWQMAADAITYQSAGAIDYSQDIAPAYPASVASGDLLVLVIGMKPSTANSGSVTTPTGWTLITSLTGAGGYSTTLGADTGNTNVFSYYKVADGTESGNLLVNLATNDVTWAQIYRFTNATGDWSVAGTTGSDVTGNTTVSIAMSSNPEVTAGDYILGAMVIPTDVTTPSQFSAEAFSQTGVTFGTVTEISEPDYTVGNDIGGFIVYSSVSSGTGSAAPTMTATAGGTVTNVRGPGIFIRVRATGTVACRSAGTAHV